MICSINIVNDMEIYWLNELKYEDIRKFVNIQYQFVLFNNIIFKYIYKDIVF